MLRRFFTSGTNNGARVWKGFEVHSCLRKTPPFPKPADCIFDIGNQRVLTVSSQSAKHEGLKLVSVGRCLVLQGTGERAWIFNCGDGTGRRLLRTPWFKWNSVFVTSMHSANINGLSALLCQGNPGDPLTIYGPQGLRKYIRATLRTCFARVLSKYTVHELYTSNESRLAQQQAADDLLHEDEMYGDDLVCSQEGLIQVMKDEKYTIQAFVSCGAMQTWGYLLHDSDSSEFKTPSIAIMHQGSKAESVAKVAKGVHVLVYGITTAKDGAVEEAGIFAKAVDAKSLVLTGVDGTKAKECDFPVVVTLPELKSITISV